MTRWRTEYLSNDFNPLGQMIVKHTECERRLLRDDKRNMYCLKSIIASLTGQLTQTEIYSHVL